MLGRPSLGWLAPGALVLALACSDEGASGREPHGEAVGGAAETPSGGASAQPGGGASSAGRAAGGARSGSPSIEEGAAGDASTFGGAGGSGGEVDGGAAGSEPTPNPGGSGGTPPEPLNGCTSFVVAASLTVEPITWEVTIGTDPRRCLRIRVGDSVTFSGQLGTHPLQPAGGTTPSPILADYPPEATAHTITFPSAGTFGYVCGSHSAMQGVIDVVD